MASPETEKLIREGCLTFEDYLAMVPEGQKADLLNGTIYMASPDNTDHNALNTWLLRVLAEFVDQRHLGETYMSRVTFRLGEKQGPEPDLAFVTQERAGLRQRGFVDGPPDLAVEIVSPDSVHRDYILKREVYEQAGVPEYWILDPDETRATFLRLNDKGKYEEVEPVDHRIHSNVVKGFWLDVRWLFQQPRPMVLTVIKQLLADSEP
jgi:Uma2 family endonuclease